MSSLMTNDQWEKASRGVDGRKYPWGNLSFRRYANTQEAFDLKVRMLPVKNLPGDVSMYGVHSLAGNFSDWNVDRDPLGLGHQVLRGIRGGNWIYQTYLARCAWRSSIEFFDPGIEISFRDVLDPNPQQRPNPARGDYELTKQ